MSTPNIVDSSGWLEYLTGSDRAALFAPAIENARGLLVPVITVYEVFKKVLRERGESDALQIASLMQAGEVIALDSSLALDAARHPLPLADALIYATALRHGATLWTQDEHFKGLTQVRYFPLVAAGKR